MFQVGDKVKFRRNVAPPFPISGHFANEIPVSDGPDTQAIGLRGLDGILNPAHLKKVPCDANQNSTNR